MQGAEAAALHFLDDYLDVAQPKLARNASQHVHVRARIQEGGNEHVAGKSADAVEIRDSAQSVPAAARAIRAAIVPAPNPSSMSTTARPAAQEHSIARSAVSPPRAEP